MRARQAVTRSVEVTVPALMRADASARVSAASESWPSPAARGGRPGPVGPGDCGRPGPAGPGSSVLADAARVAAAAAAAIEIVNSRRERGFMSGNDTLGQRSNLPAWIHATKPRKHEENL